MARSNTPERVDAVIIGQALRARPPPKVLTERGVRVVALETRPVAKQGNASAATNSPTSTATISGPTRCSIRAPARTFADRERRTWRCSARCRRWSAAGPCTGRVGCRASRPTTFASARIAGDVAGRHRLPTGPSPTHELEPYYAKVEWAFGVSGPRRRQHLRRSAQSSEYPVPAACRSPATPRNSTRVAMTLGWNSFPTPQAGVVARRSTVVPPTVDQRVRATAWRPDRHPLERPERVRSRRREDRPL